MKILTRIGFWLMVIVIGVFALFPLYYAIISSFDEECRRHLFFY